MSENVQIYFVLWHFLLCLLVFYINSVALWGMEFYQTSAQFLCQAASVLSHIFLEFYPSIYPYSSNPVQGWGGSWSLSQAAQMGHKAGFALDSSPSQGTYSNSVTHYGQFRDTCSQNHMSNCHPWGSETGGLLYYTDMRKFPELYLCNPWGVSNAETGTGDLILPDSLPPPK